MLRGLLCDAGHVDEVEGGAGEGRPELVPRQSDVAEFPAAADGLDSAEDLFDPFTDTLARGASRMTYHSVLDATAPVGAVAEHGVTLRSYTEGGPG